MKYSQVKSLASIMKQWGYKKEVGMHRYRKVWRWETREKDLYQLGHIISTHEILSMTESQLFMRLGHEDKKAVAALRKAVIMDGNGL